MLPKTFCCCWNTTIGCVVIGYVTGGLSITLCVGSVMRLFFGLPLILQNDDFQGQFPFNPLFFVFTAMYFGFHTITSFGLVPGVKEGQGMFIVPTMVMLSVDILLSFIGVIVLGMMLGKQSESEDQNELEDYFISGIVIGSILLPLLIYFIFIVTSEFEEIFKKLDQVPLQKSEFEDQAQNTDTQENGKYGTIV